MSRSVEPASTLSLLIEPAYPVSMSLSTADCDSLTLCATRLLVPPLVSMHDCVCMCACLLSLLTRLVAWYVAYAGRLTLVCASCLWPVAPPEAETASIFKLCESSQEGSECLR